MGFVFLRKSSQSLLSPTLFQGQQLIIVKWRDSVREKGQSKRVSKAMQTERVVASSWPG